MDHFISYFPSQSEQYNRIIFIMQWSYYNNRSYILLTWYSEFVNDTFIELNDDCSLCVNMNMNVIEMYPAVWIRKWIILLALKFSFISQPCDY